MQGTTRSQQKDLMCGFYAFTGLEISLSKAEAIHINYGDIMYNTPFLVLFMIGLEVT